MNNIELNTKFGLPPKMSAVAKRFIREMGVLGDNTDEIDTVGASDYMEKQMYRNGIIEVGDITCTSGMLWSLSESGKRTLANIKLQDEFVMEQKNEPVV